MAWQLIYTSAPRLLDAGRTGFGTVARHRAVSGLLASTIERFSQFARLPGYDTKRIVYSHRLLTVGSGEFHVLSCLRDAGSDYTGRTNHLAHHIIAEAREIRNLGLAGITPADILLGMPWLETWTSSPRFLESADEINLSTFRNPESHEWQRLTGNLHHALLPWSPSAKKGLYFVLPPGLDARPLILESLQEHPGDSWKIPFTTNLEPNDDVADFKWIAVPATSPLCPQPGTAARLILDLTQPAQLPAPPSLPTETHYSEAASAPSPATLNTPAPIAPSPALPPPSSNPQFPSTAPVPAWSPTPAQSQKSLGLTTRLLIGSAAAIVMIGGALLISNFINQRSENQRVAEVTAEIDRIWLEQKPNLIQTRTLLKKKARIDPYPTTKLKELEAELAKIRKNLVAGVPSETANAISMTLDAEFDELLKDYASWKAVHEQAAINRDWTAQSPGELTPTLATLLGEESRLSAKVSAHFTDKPNAPTYEWRKAMHDNLAKSLSESKGLPQGTAKEWSELFHLILPDSPQPEWVGLWAQLATLPIDNRVKKLEGVLKSLADQKNAPPWVSHLVKRKLEEAQALVHRAQPQATSQTKPQDNSPKQLDASLDTAMATHFLHLLFLNQEPNAPKQETNELLKIHSFDIKERMRFWVGDFQTPAAQLKQWALPEKSKQTKALTVRESFGSDKKITLEGTALSLNFQIPKGLRLIAVDEDQQTPTILFELRISQEDSNPPEPLNFTPIMKSSVSLNGEVYQIPELEQFIQRCRIVPATTTKWSIIASSQGSFGWTFPLHPAGNLTPMHLKNGINPEVKKLSQEIDKLIESEKEPTRKIKLYNDQLKELEKSPKAKKIKDEETNSIKLSLSKAEGELTHVQDTLKQKREALKNAPKILPRPGQYFLEFGSVRLCKIELTAPAPAAPDPK
jgi:hypothetical protein